MSSPFVGRSRELGTLRDLIARARREIAPAAALITGEPGIGKSRLLREAIAGADARRRVVMSGFEPTEPIPLAAAADLFRHLAAVPDHGPRLQGLAFGGSDRSAEGALQVFEAANRALHAFGPLVLAIDDLQWVDSQSVALAHYLLNAAESARHPLVIVAASRPSPAAASFADGVPRSLSENRQVSITLRGLPLAEGIRLARAIDESLDARGAEVLLLRAAGNPFWLEALARAGHKSEADDFIGGRLRALSADAGAVLNVLAIGARPFDGDELRACIEWSPERLAHALRELVGRGVVIDESGRIRLAHDLIREAAAQSIPASTRRATHGRLARLLERSAGDDLHRLAEALDHRAAAGLPTADLALRLVTAPTRSLLEGDALQQLSKLADDLPADSPERLELDAGLGQLATELADQELAIRHWRRVSAATTDPRVQQKAELEAGKAGYETLPSAEVHAHLARARSLAENAIDAVEIDTVEARVLLEVDDQITEGVAVAERAIATGRQLVADAGGIARLSSDVRRVLLEAFEVTSDGALQEERALDAITLAGEARSLAAGLDDEARLVALLHDGYALSSLGRLPEAAATYREAWDLADRLIRPRAMLEAGIYLTRVFHRLGRQVEARSIISQVEELQSRIRPWVWGNLIRGHSLIVDLALGERHSLEQFDALAPSLNRHFAIMAHQWVAAWQARQHGERRAQEVENQLLAGQAAADAVGCRQCSRELQVVSAELLARIGNVERAQRALESWDGAFTGTWYAMRDLWRARAEAAIAVASGSPDAADALAALAEAFEDEGLVQDAAWAWIDLGRLTRETDDRHAATTAYARAARAAHEIGSPSIERLANRALRELGVRAWRRSPATSGDGVSALSSREREVAGLVADGATNAEVAERLAIAPKTIERHLTNILAKLGARNRTELSSLMHGAPVRGSPDD